MGNAALKIDGSSSQTIKLYSVHGIRIEDLSKEGVSTLQIIKAQGSPGQIDVKKLIGKNRLVGSGNPAQPTQPPGGPQLPNAKSLSSPDAQNKKTLFGFLAAAVISSAFTGLVHFNRLFGEATSYIQLPMSFLSILLWVITGAGFLTKSDDNVHTHSDITTAD